MIYSHYVNDYNNDCFGENTFKLTNDNPNGEKPVDSWCEE